MRVPIFDLVLRERPAAAGIDLGVAGAIAPAALAAWIAAQIGDAATERLLVIFLNGRRQIIGASVVAVGTINGADPSPAEIFRPALVAGAAEIALGHNHPSGCLQPSPEDVRFYAGIDRLGAALRLPLLDAFIVGPVPGYWSWREAGGR